MNKGIFKIIFIVVLFLLIPTSNSLASDNNVTDIDINGYSTTIQHQKSEFDSIGKVIFGAVQGLGIGVSVIVLAIIGVKYMVGSVEEKADYKANMIPYLIGVFFIASASTIPNIIYNLLN